jgi:hypothetical protein
MITETLYNKVTKVSYATAANIGIKFSKDELDELSAIVAAEWLEEVQFQNTVDNY